jgi:putative heme-binding domain-containing protein
MRLALAASLCLVFLAPLHSPAAPASPGIAPLVRLLTTTDDVDVQRDVLRGMEEALRGRRQIPAPEGWSAVLKKLGTSSDAEIRQKVLLLSAQFGDADAVAALRKTAANPLAATENRRSALQTLVETKTDNLLPLLRELLTDPVMCGPAIRGLAAIKEPSTPELLLKQYEKFSDAEKADVVQTLASRPEYVRALLDAIEKGQVPNRDLSPFIARQILAFKDKALSERLNTVWGVIRPPDKDKAALLAKYKSLVPPDALKKADRSAGRAVFVKTCAACHTLFNDGGKIGPDLTGSQRANPEYILSKVLDPNAVVARDFQVTVFSTKDGRVISGIIKAENAKIVTVQTPNEVFNLEKADIEERTRSTQSIMPEGQLAKMTDAEVRDLIAYLGGVQQVPLPGAKPEK